MSNRRIFLKQLLFSTLGLQVPHFMQGAPHLPASWPSQEEVLWPLVRNSFPIAKEKTYLNTGTIGISPHVVIDELKRTLDRLEAYGEYSGWERTAPDLAAFFSVDPDEMCLTHNATEGINIVAAGLPLGAGDEIIMTTHEHVGNAVPWLHQAKLKNCRIVPFEPQPSIQGNLDAIASKMTARTRVIAIPHVTCTTGLRLPVAQISEMARAKGIWVCVDGAQAPGSIEVNIKALGCHTYAGCGHKWMMGPKGTGFLYISKEIEVLPTYAGGYSNSGWEISLAEQRLLEYQPQARRHTVGTQNAALFSGLSAALQFMTTLGMGRIEAKVQALSSYLIAQLSENPNVQLLTPSDERLKAGMVSFKHARLSAQEIQAKADKALLRLRIVPESGLNAVRISTHIYNNEEDIQRLLPLLA
jgi:selenocysteine lyase/cysteine desulfurase